MNCITFRNKRVRNLAVSIEWAISEVIRDNWQKHSWAMTTKEVPPARPQQLRRLVYLERPLNWRMCKLDTELAYWSTCTSYHLLKYMYKSNYKVPAIIIYSYIFIGFRSAAAERFWKWVGPVLKGGGGGGGGGGLVHLFSDFPFFPLPFILWVGGSPPKWPTSVVTIKKKKR